MGPPYLILKLKAVLFRAFGKWRGRLVGLFSRSIPDWKRAYNTATNEYTIPSSKSKRSIRIRRWAAPDQSVGLRPVHVNFHGSGFIVPNLGGDSDFCQLLSKRLNITVLDCDYAKAPENPFPAAYHDVEDVFAHVLSSSSLYDLSNFTVGGFSAGAGVALTVSATSPLVQPHKIKAIVPVYPGIDISVPAPPPPKPLKGSTSMEMHPWMLELFWSCYVQGDVSRKDPRVSVKYADVDKLPRKVCLVRAERDALRPEADEYEIELKDAGVEVSGLVVKDVGHGFDKGAKLGTWEHDRKTEAYEFILKFLQGVYAA